MVVVRIQDDSLSIPGRWRAWRQRLRGDREDLLGVLANLTLPQRRTPEEVDTRVSRAAVLCDAALFMLWLARVAPPETGRPLQQRPVNVTDFRPADVVAFVGSLAATGVDDEELSALSRREFDQCWHKEASFREDLIAYLFRPEVHLAPAFRAQDNIRDLLLNTGDFSGFVVAAAPDVQAAANDPLIALGSLFAVSFPRDANVQRLVRAVSQRSRASWAALYRNALEHYGKMPAAGTLGRPHPEPTDVTPATLLAGIQLLVNVFIPGTEKAVDNDVAVADTATLGQYRRHLVLNEKLTADERTLGLLQQAHLDAFAYSNLDVMLGRTSLDLPNYLGRLMNARHGGLCYQLNYSLALILRAVGFSVDYLWGTVSKERGKPGNPAGNHLGLQVTVGERKWLADAGLGDGPREPLLLTPGPVRQGAFRYELIEKPDMWVLVHDRRGSFAEVTFAKRPVQVEEFREPASVLFTDPSSGFRRTLAVMKRRADEAHLLRGRVYEVIGERPTLTHVVASQEEWLQLLGSQFGVFLGNVSEEQQRELWGEVCASHEQWTRKQ
jgi:N-hydroxyarylamine O-acetyltransferase